MKQNGRLKENGIIMTTRRKSEYSHGSQARRLILSYLLSVHSPMLFKLR